MDRVWVSLILVALVVSGCGSTQNANGGVEQSGDSTAQQRAQMDTRGFSPLALGLQLLLDREAGASSCVSPVGLMMALGMAREGARGATREELDAFLGSACERSNRALGHSRDGDGALRVANAIWSDEGLQLAGAFVDSLRLGYGASARALPLRAQPQQAAEAINGWVKENTKGLIDRLVEAGDVAQSAMVLTNALYFKGLWARPFDGNDTERAKFYSFHGERDVDMMHQEGQFRYAEDTTMQVLEMPYQEKGYGILVVLPRASAKDARWDSIDAQRVEALFGALEYERVDVSFPRFTSQATLRLVPALQRLGLRASLSSAADFSGMGKGFGGEQIGEVIQAVRFTVDEEKTEAAAASGVVMMRASLPPEAVKFEANRPFLYIVYRESVENAVFVGVLDD